MTQLSQTPVTQTSMKLVARAVSEIENGRPFWGLIQANSWFAGNGAMQRVIAAKALAFLAAPEYADVKDLVAELVAGTSLDSLTSEQQARARAVVESSSNVSRRAIPVMPERVTRFARAVPVPQRRMAR